MKRHKYIKVNRDRLKKAVYEFTFLTILFWHVRWAYHHGIASLQVVDRGDMEGSIDYAE